MKLRDLMFVVPNLFTVSSIFFGFYAMTLCVVDGSEAQLSQAAFAIFFAACFDAFDGRVARLTQTQSLFGQQLDSLADVVSFGAAPALLVWKWALMPLGFVGALVSFVYVACGALRLARFNVLAVRAKSGGGSQFFIGMPIPFAAIGIISMIIAFQSSHAGPLSEEYRWPILGVVLMLALLMVSTVRYRTFKEVRPTLPVGILLGIIIAMGIAVARWVHPAWVLSAFFGVYLVSGLIESALMLRRFIIEKRTASLADVVDEDDDQELDGKPDVGDHEYL